MRVVFASVVLVVVTSACASRHPASRVSTTSSASPSPSASAHALPTSGLLAGVDWSGGLCANVPACRSAVSVDVDGTWHHLESSKTTTGRLTQARLDALKAAVLASTLDTAKDFTGQCPTVYDGSEATYHFVRDGKRFDVASCTKEVPSTDPLATVLTKVYDETSPR